METFLLVTRISNRLKLKHKHMHDYAVCDLTVSVLSFCTLAAACRLQKRLHTYRHGYFSSFFFCWLDVLLLLAFTPQNVRFFYACSAARPFCKRIMKFTGRLFFFWVSLFERLTWEDNGGRSAHNTEEGAIDGVVVARTWHFALFFVVCLGYKMKIEIWIRFCCFFSLIALWFLMLCYVSACFTLLCKLK